MKSEGSTASHSPRFEVGLDLRDSERLHFAESLLAMVVESTTAAIFVKDPQGRYVFVNRKCEELWGLQRSSVVGSTDAQLLPAECAARLAENDRATLQAQKAMEFEEVIDFPSGRRVFLSLKAPLVARDGTAYGLYGIATDVTDRVRDRHALEESEARFRLLADRAPVLIWMTDVDDRLVYVNKRWLDFTGKSLAEETGSGWRGGVHEEDLPQVENNAAAMQERRPFQATLRLRRHDGVFRWMLDTAVPRVAPDGEFAGFIGSMVDVTEARELEAALARRTLELAERDRRKDEFLAMLGHELRNPLAALRGATDLLKLKQLATSEGVAPETAVLDRQLTQLTRLVDDLLDVARLTRGKVQLFRSNARLDAVVELAIDAVRQAIERQSQHLEIDLPNEPVEIFVDPTRVAQVITNLVLNASKYSPPGSTIRLVVRHAEELELRVIDDGIGIPHELLTSVFEPFVQARHDYHRLGDGLGLGLTLVRALVELHGGTVEARSAGLDRGSEFIVRLPARAPELHGEADGAGGAVAVAGPRSVLVVDDNVDSAELLAELLRSQGHSVDITHDGGTALDRAESVRPDVALVDLALPVLDGFAVARALRARFGPELRLVAVTGYGRDQDRRAAREAGFDGYLVKPVTNDQLANAVYGGPGSVGLSVNIP